MGLVQLIFTAYNFSLYVCFLQLTKSHLMSGVYLIGLLELRKFLNDNFAFYVKKKKAFC